MDASSLTVQGLLLLAVFVVFYLTLVRPQQMKLRRHQRMLDNLRPGDHVSTHGGLVGTIVETNHDELVTLEIAPNVQVSVTRKGIDQMWPARQAQGVNQEIADGQTSPSLG